MITRNGNKSIALMAEVVAVLARYPGLRCAPVVDQEDGLLSLSITIDSDDMQVVSLGHELKYVADVAQVRHIAREYNIDAAKLEALLPAMHDDAPPHMLRHLTVQEVEAVVAVLTEQTGPADPPTDTDRVLDSATIKLVELGRALAGAV